MNEEDVLNICHFHLGPVDGLTKEHGHGLPYRGMIIGKAYYFGIKKYKIEGVRHIHYFFVGYEKLSLEKLEEILEEAEEDYRNENWWR